MLDTDSAQSGLGSVEEEDSNMEAWAADTGQAAALEGCT